MSHQTSLNAEPYWFQVALPTFSPLSADMEVDVVVVGGGLTGLTAAYLLATEGARVALVERGSLASADTGHTTAHLTYVTDYRLHELVDHFGKEAAQAFWRAGTQAIDKIGSIVGKLSMDCEFKRVPGYLHQSFRDQGRNSADELSRLRRDAELAKELGFSASWVDSVPYAKTPGIRFDDQAKFHPRKYLRGLIDAMRKLNVHIFEHTNYEAIEEKPMAVRANGKRIKCDYVVIATHNPVMGMQGIVGATLQQTKLALYSSYVVGAKLPPDSVTEGLYWDTHDPYDYLRVDNHADHQYVIFGGEDVKTGQEPDTARVFETLDSRFKSLFPQAQVTHHWMGQVVETDDGLPFIGENASRQFIATGFCGNGFTLGTLAAEMATERFAGREHQCTDLLRVDRKPFHGGVWRYLKENVDYPAQMIKDRLSKPALQFDELGNGQGGLVTMNGEKVAAYRTDSGELQLCSPTCTHMGCLVKWNNVDHTWDCPCHGSRFMPDGAVFSGPAEKPLEPLSAMKAPDTMVKTADAAAGKSSHPVNNPPPQG